MKCLVTLHFFFLGGRGGGRNQRNPKKVPTLEELDAELDAYSKELK